MKRATQLSGSMMPCCAVPAVLKTSINGLPSFSRLFDECEIAPETKWHKAGKAAVLAALGGMDIHGRDEVTGRSPGD